MAQWMTDRGLCVGLRIEPVRGDVDKQPHTAISEEATRIPPLSRGFPTEPTGLYFEGHTDTELINPPPAVVNNNQIVEAIAAGVKRAISTVAVAPTVQIEQPIMESMTVSGIATADMGVKKLRELGKELGLSFPASTTKVEMAEAINAKK